MKHNYFKLFILIGFLVTNGHGATLTVSPSSSGYTSLKSAIKAASIGDTIFIDAGIYKENTLIVSKPLTIIGRNSPILDGNNKGTILEVNADNVTINNIVFKNVGKSYTTDYAAIHVHDAKYFHFENNTMNNVFFGFHIEKSKNGTIKNNRIHGNATTEQSSGNGIHLWHSSKIHILGNTIEHMRDGFYFEFVKHSFIEHNYSHNNIRYGMHFMFSNDDRYEHNTFENNGAGVAVMFSKRISMRYNNFRLNWGAASYGLLLKEINDADIKENTFFRNTIGVSADGANRISFTKNVFQNNGWGIRFLGACYGFKIIQNNFMHNALDIAYRGNINGNIFDKNYWSEYSGYDLDKNNIGDVPYRPVKLFSYIVNQTPETIILLRSLFVDIINFSEKVSPIFTPDELKDNHPSMKPVQTDD